MNAQDFCYWLKGFSELSGAQPTPEQWQSIKDHLDTVFMKVTPPVKLLPQESDSDKLRKFFDEAKKQQHLEKPFYDPYRTPSIPGSGKLIC